MTRITSTSNVLTKLAAVPSYVFRWGGMQEMWIGGDRFNLTILLHELGHALCLGHEDTRVDRGDYVDFSSCEFIVDPDEFDTRVHLYDYWSVMYYICGFCIGGGGYGGRKWKMCHCSNVDKLFPREED